MTRTSSNILWDIQPDKLYRPARWKHVVGQMVALLVVTFCIALMAGYWVGAW